MARPEQASAHRRLVLRHWFRFYRKQPFSRLGYFEAPDDLSEQKRVLIADGDRVPLAGVCRGCGATRSNFDYRDRHGRWHFYGCHRESHN